MVAYQQRQQLPQHYMRPPPQQPPAPADPHLQQQHYYHYQPPPPGSWYSNQFQFQYHHQQHNQSHSALPHHPPSPQQPPSQWGPPPHPDHSAYPPPHPHPFPPHIHNGSNHFPPPPPHPPVPRPYMPPSQIPNTFSHVSEEWSNPNWSHHQVPAHNKVEDWGAKAREWAIARAAVQDQPVQSQITPAGRPEEQNHFHNPYSQTGDSHYMDAQQSLPISSYQQFPVPTASPHGPPATYPTETLCNSSRPSSYVPDGCLPYYVGDGTSPTDPNSGFLHQESLLASSSVHLQEVPSSYSSVSGKEKSAGEKELSYKSLPLPISPAQESASDAVYPPVLLPGTQHDPLSAPSPVSGHMTPSFPRFPGPTFQPHIPSATAPFALGVGAQLHPTADFPGGAYGAISERPKKGPVPNWLKEEILRNKATIAKSYLEHPKEETEYIEDEAVGKSLAKNDQADSKSIDSSRSTEEDDDEDYVEAARTTAINLEIKRVLTEVLLKVTDELFSEIATKVVNEDDSIVEVDHNTFASNHMVSPSSSLVPTPKASARVLVPGKAKEPDNAEEKSSSRSAGNVLGLANYASDDEDVDGEIQSSRMTHSRGNDAVAHSSTNKLTQDNVLIENSNSQAVLDEHRGVEKNLESDMKSKNRSDSTEDSADRNYEKLFSSKVVSGYVSNINNGKLQDGNNGSKMTDTSGERVTKKSDSELPDEHAGKKSTKSVSQGREMRVKSDKNDRHESRKSLFSKDPGSGSRRELEVIKSRGEQRGDENYMREDERLRKKKIEDRNGTKEREKKPKPLEKAKESDSRKRSSHHGAKDRRKDADRSNRASAKEDVGGKRERTKEEDRSRHKRGSDSSRHKRRRSLSISSRDRKSKDNSSDHANESSDDTSDSSKRKSRSGKRSSPSPIKSRRRGRRSRSRSPVRR